jgi:hypothetical protein
MTNKCMAENDNSKGVLRKILRILLYIPKITTFPQTEIMMQVYETFFLLLLLFLTLQLSHIKSNYF